jgi:hypothetical protein
MQCVEAGLQEFRQATVSVDEYHVLVHWMYAHCAVDNDEPQSVDVPVPDPRDDAKAHTHMTKLEFYYKIRDHFMSQRSDMQGKVEAQKLRSNVAAIQREKLVACIKEAADRFGSYTSYEQPEHFHDAVAWIQEECVHT